MSYTLWDLATILRRFSWPYNHILNRLLVWINGRTGFFLGTFRVPVELWRVVLSFLLDLAERLASFLANNAMKKPSPFLTGSVRIRSSAVRWGKEEVWKYTKWYDWPVNCWVMLPENNNTYSLQTLEDHGTATRGRALPIGIHTTRLREEQIWRHLHSQFGWLNTYCRQFFQQLELPNKQFFLFKYCRWFEEIF